MDWGLDTSALVRILTQQPPELAERVITRVASILDEGSVFFVSDTVVSEAYYVLQHFYGATKEDAVSDLLEFSRQPGFHFSWQAVSALSQPNPATMSPGLVDRMIAGDYRAQGLRVLACEKDFRRLPDAEVVS